MHDHVDPLHKALQADVAGERPLSGMCPLVLGQVDPLIESLGAQVALELWFAFVPLFVPEQRSPVGELGTALLALVEALEAALAVQVALMRLFVLEQRRLMGELGAALIAHVGRFVVVTAQVHCQVLPDWKHVRAQVALESRLPVVGKNVLSEFGLPVAQLETQHATVPPCVNVCSFVFHLVLAVRETGTAVYAPERQLL